MGFVIPSGDDTVTWGVINFTWSGRFSKSNQISWIYKPEYENENPTLIRTEDEFLQVHQWGFDGDRNEECQQEREG